MAVEAVAVTKKQRRYSGELLEPLSLGSLPTFNGAATDERVRKFWVDYSPKAERQIAIQLKRKMTLLKEHYGVNDMSALALALAREHVPGFRVGSVATRRAGRRRTWNVDRLQKLHDTVNAVKEKHSFRDRQALKFIVNNKEYSGIWGQPKNHKGLKSGWIETLESRLQEAKRLERSVKAAIASLTAAANSGN
jgi:hypothetical protein